MRKEEKEKKKKEKEKKEKKKKKKKKKMKKKKEKLVKKIHRKAFIKYICFCFYRNYAIQGEKDLIGDI